MSWLKSVSSSEDVFDEDADEIALQSKEWRSNMEKRVKDGYRDGVDAGKEASLQVGFNMGYKEGAALTVHVGRLKGIVSAILAWCQTLGPDAAAPPAVTDLLQQVTQYEDALMGRMLEALSSAPSSVSDISEGMEDLGLSGGSPGRSGEEGSRGVSLVHDCCSQPTVGLDHLLQCSVQLVLELGLPQELINDLLSLKSAV